MRTMSLDEYIDGDRAQFEYEVVQYMTNYKVPEEIARRDVRDAWYEGLCDSDAAFRTTDWDYGQD